MILRTQINMITIEKFGFNKNDILAKVKEHPGDSKLDLYDDQNLVGHPEKIALQAELGDKKILLMEFTNGEGWSNHKLDTSITMTSTNRRNEDNDEAPMEGNYNYNDDIEEK